MQKKTVKIEGMMCPHCEARVQKCLEAAPFTSEVSVSHKTGEASFLMTAEVTDADITKIIEEQGYKVISIN